MKDFPFLKASWWTGGSWLVTLCVIHVLTIIFYLIVHAKYCGHEYIQLEQEQVKTLGDLLAIYPDYAQPTSILKHSADSDKAVHHLYDSVSNLRIQRTRMVKQFLTTAYKGDIDITQLNEMEATLNELNTKDCATYLAARKFSVRNEN